MGGFQTLLLPLHLVSHLLFDSINYRKSKINEE